MKCQFAFKYVWQDMLKRFQKRKISLNFELFENQSSEMWWRVRQTEICAPDAAETVFISLCSSQKLLAVKYIFAGRRRRNQIRFCSPPFSTPSVNSICVSIYPPAGLIFDLTKTWPYSTYWNFIFWWHTQDIPPVVLFRVLCSTVHYFFLV